MFTFYYDYHAHVRLFYRLDYEEDEDYNLWKELERYSNLY